MDGARDQYEERLKEVFESFDGSGLGSLSLEELSDLCRALQLEENTLNTLVHTLVQDQLEERIHFEQFKDALIHVLSKPNTDEPQESLEQDSPEVQPRFVKGSKRYGRRSAPEFIHANPQTQSEDEEENDEEFECDYRTAPRKRERWNADVSFSEEFEAEGQLHFWNPDEPTTPRGNALPVYSVEERLESACLHLSVPFNGTATQQQLHALCQHIGLEVSEDLFKCADGSAMLVQDFISCIVNHSKPPTPSGSTPYRQFKRLHSTQFDESGRRFSSALSSTIGPQLFSVLDDGSGHAPVENLLYRWMEEGICNSSEILQALDFDLEGKVNLSELTIALENELLSTKNSIHQVALVSFKAEIRHLLECLDLERREKDRIRFDLEKAEKLKSQLVSEVDERHTAIERNNEVNLRKLEQEYKDSMMALKSELNKEVELVQQQANQQREELEEEICKRRDDENFIKEHLSLTIKEKGRLETELLETTDKLMDSELQLSKVQKTLDVLKEKFGGLDPHSDELYQADDHLQHLRRSYEEQCRDFQDRIDELEAQLEEHQLSNHIPPKRESGQSLCDELNLTSLEPVSQEQESVNINLETEMLQQHQQEIENLRKMIYEEQCSSENELSHLSLLHQQEVQALSQDITREQQRANKLEAELSTQNALHQQELLSLTQEAQDARKRAECIEEKVQVLEEAQSAYEEQSRVNAAELSERKHQEVLEQSLQEQREQLLEERRNEERRLAEQWKREQEQFKEKHEELLSSQLEQLRDITDNECRELERRLREEWELEKEVLEEKSREEFQVLLEEKERKLKEEWELKRQELEEIGKQALRTVLEEGMEREERLRIQWEEEQTLLKNQHQDLLLRRLEEERKLLRTQQQESENLMMEHWERERDRLEEQHNETLHLCLERERNVLRDEEEKRMQDLKNEAGRVDEAHREAIRELSAKHGEERERLGSLLEKLRADIAEQRRELERQFSRRLKEVEVRFCAEQDTVTERFQVDICHLEQLYQSEIASLTQKHSADKALWEEQTNAADEKAKQQLKLLRETMNQLKMDLQLLETAYAQDIKALTDKNTQVQAELESFITAARTKDTDLTCEINQLKDHLTETMEARDLLLAQVTKLEGILKEAEKEKLELEKKLVAFTGRPDEASSSSEVMEKIQESEEMLHQDLNEGNGDVSKCHSNPGMKSSVSKVEEEAFCENAVLFDEDGEKDMLNCTNVSTEDASVEKARTVQRITNSDHILDIWNQKISAVVQNKSGVSPGLDGQTKYERRLAETEITNYQTENKIKTWESLELNLSETEIRQDVCLQESWGLKRDAGRLPNCAWNFSSEETIRESTTPSELKTTQRSCDHEGTRNIECVHTHEDEDFREQTKVPQKLKSKGQHRDSDMSDSPCKSILKNKVAAVVELEFYCLEFEKQNTQLRRALANLRGRSLQIHKQMQRQSNEICRLTKENSILSHKILTVGVEDQRRNPSDQRFKHVHQTKRTVQALRRQLSEPRRPSPQLEEENGSPQQNGERVLQQGVKLHLANERNGGFGREEFASRTEKELLKAELNIYAEKVIFLNSSVQTLNQQNTRLKSELHVTQEEREALKQEVVSLHKQMQSANEKIRHLEALSVKHRGLMKSAEQENSPLKREMEALHTQLLSTQNKTHLAVVLPSSGETRGPRHHDVPDFSTQDEREMVLLQMEDRMREVELTLRNLKVLLQEKVSQLKEQVIRNGESDVLIKDLYVENAQLLKALEKTEQRHKVVEKRNFLLEEKISSLNKIVRDLGPSPLTPAPYHFTRS